MKKVMNCLGGGIYKNASTKKFYHRPTIDGKPTWRVLDVHKLKLARELKTDLDSSQTMAGRGLVKDPYAPAPATVGELITGYLEKNCPDRKQRQRTGKLLEEEKAKLAFLLPFWKDKQADQVKPMDCPAYFEYRRTTMRPGFFGGRKTDMELGTLTNVFRWAVYAGKLDSNPLLQRLKFQGTDGKKIRHCRECMPRSAQELSSLAHALFEVRCSERLGWQLLLEALTGCRTQEVLRLRWDATEGQPGFIDETHLHIVRSKGGCNPLVQIHDELRQTLEALKQWRIARGFADSPWFIPGRFPGEPVEKTSLTSALARIGPLVCGQGQKRTSHGLRAYYVTARRSQGIQDAQIAAEIGDRTGPLIISSTYGEIPEVWQKRTAKPMGWLTDPAPWVVLDLPGNLLQIERAVNVA